MFKNYRHMSYNDKSKVLVDQNEIEKIEKNLAKQIENSKKGHHPDPRLFEAIHYRNYKILKQYNLPEFYQKVLQIPTKLYKRYTCPQVIRFSSCDNNVDSISLYQRTTQNIHHNLFRALIARLDLIRRLMAWVILMEMWLKTKTLLYQIKAHLPNLI